MCISNAEAHRSSLRHRIQSLVLTGHLHRIKRQTSRLGDQSLLHVGETELRYMRQKACGDYTCAALAKRGVPSVATCALIFLECTEAVCPATERSIPLRWWGTCLPNPKASRCNATAYFSLHDPNNARGRGCSHTYLKMFPGRR